MVDENGSARPSILIMSAQPPSPEKTAMEKVQSELRRYQHPLVVFSACDAGEGGGVNVLIQLRDRSVSAHTYTIHLAPRDLENPRFAWAFQRRLYDSLHDYIT